MDLLQKSAGLMGIHLNTHQKNQFGDYYSELTEWNKKASLTSVVGRKEVERRHFLDSLTLWEAIPLKTLGSDVRLLDVGTGGGFPGIPLKIAFPQLELYLLDATAKKTVFLSHVVKTLGLNGVTVLTGRAEELAHDRSLRATFNLVVSRAVSKMNVLAELTIPFAMIGGSVIAQKGTIVDAEIAQARNAIEKTGGKLDKKLRSVIVEGTLVIVKKVGPTPEVYPRHTGIPAKRPL